jgi:pyruvate/2-oxoglutarate dehydrogenase complex dihydrolipoamide acyltransferase (E2) component
VVNVFLSNGSKVLKGSLIAEVMNRGSLQRISSPVNGYVEEVFFRIGDYVKVGGDLFSVVESKA